MYDKKIKKQREMRKKNMLTGGQAKIAAKAPPPNVIDEKDFVVLREEKKKVKPVKAALGLATMGILGAKYLKDKNKKAMALPGVGAAALMAKKKKEILGKKRGGMGQATEYKKYLKGLKEASSSKTKKTYSSMEEMRKAKGFKPGETASEFNKRRMALEAGKKALRASTVGKIALGVGAAGVAAQQYLKSKMKKKPEQKPIQLGEKRKKMPGRMGGGMIGASQKPGYSKGTMVKARGCKLGRARPTKIT